jgi:hypothetical protein
VQPANIAHNIVSRAQVQMISIAQSYLTAECHKVGRGNATLDSGACRYIHKYGRLYIAVNGVEYSSPRPAFGFYEFEHNDLQNLLLKFVIYNISVKDVSVLLLLRTANGSPYNISINK